MTSARIDKIVKKLREIAETDYSEYAGFNLKDISNSGYHHCFIVNNQPYHSSNLTLRLEDYSDAVKIISRFRKQTEKETLDELSDHGFIDKDLDIFLHYLKLQMTCQ